MEDQSYKLVLEGKLRDGIERPQAVKKLSAVLKRDVEEIAELLSGKPRVMVEGLDYRAALKYQSLLASVGALSRIEPEAGVAAAVAGSVDQHPAEEPEHPSSDRNLCPKCGYQPTREDDVLLVRGDCPRCGLKVAAYLDEESDEAPGLVEELVLSDRSGVRTIYGYRTPASWKRRALASVHTFFMFLAVYCCLAMLFVFSFVPLALVPGFAGKGLLDAAFMSFPLFLAALSIILISFVLPIFNRGLSWGQKLAGIVVLYTQDAQIGGLYLSLGFRVASIGLMSFAPGLIILWLVSNLGIAANPVSANAVMIATAILSWVGSWVYLVRTPEKRGVLDRAGGTIQTEDQPLPQDAVKKGLIPIGVVVVSSIVSKHSHTLLLEAPKIADPLKLTFPGLVTSQQDR